MKNYYTLFVALFFLSSTTIFSQTSADSFWSPVKESSIRVTGVKQIIPQKFLTFSLNGNALESKLFAAPHEKTTLINQSACIITLPLPNGTFQRFKVIESPIMAPALGAAFPGMKTFSVKGIDDASASGKLDWTGWGFHGMILTSNGDFFIDPYCVGNTQDYITYYTADFVKNPAHVIPEASLDLIEGQVKQGVPFEASHSSAKSSAIPGACIGNELRTYRLAVACTGEYAKAATGLAAPSVAQTFSRIVTSINRVDGVYEKELAIRMVLVPNATLVVFTDPATDPFNGNNNAGTLIGESQTVITNNIGSNNYDIGHTFSTGGGGLANLGAVCRTNDKARGITGSGSPVGDPYDIDYVAHEMGHQFAGNHTFNAITGGCNGNRSGSTSAEPGSGVTIMAYAGLCSGNNVANRSIPYFHAISYDEIINYSQIGFGNTCAVTSTTGNNPPVVVGSAAYIIPKGTPFVLTGSATDIDGDKLYYSWEETDLGTVGGNWNSGSKPFFRSYPPDTITAPATQYSRFFPRKSVVLNGNYTGTIGEYLPQAAQNLNFRLTVRDNKMGGGGVCHANTSITVDEAGPLTVSYPSATGIGWAMGTTQLLVWEVNSTDQPPISCDTVRIWISYDSGNNYSILLNSTPNDGFENIVVPTLPATVNTCRIKIESKANIFYDISNNNFTISSDPTVGLNTVSQNNPVGLTVWPNPFSNEINFIVGNLNSKTNTTVKVLDMLGKTVLQFNYSGKSELKESIDLSPLSNGVYFINVNNNNNSSVHRVIKN